MWPEHSIKAAARRGRKRRYVTALQVSPRDGEGSGKHLYLKSTLSTAPLSEPWQAALSEERADIRKPPHAEYTPHPNPLPTHLFSCESGTSLWWLFYQRSCPSRGEVGGPRRMTLIFWKQSVQYWSVGMSGLWHGLIYWTREGSLFPVIPELIALTFTTHVLQFCVDAHTRTCDFTVHRLSAKRKIRQMYRIQYLEK